MVHNGSPSLHTNLEDSDNEGNTASGGRGSSGTPTPRGCIVVTPAVPKANTPLPEHTPTYLTILMVPLRTTTPQPGTEFLREQHQAYQEVQP
jgi:hypothetical protein